MVKKRGSKKTQPNRFLGTYLLSGGKHAVGELRLKGSSTLLRLHSDEFLPGVEAASCIKGVAYTGECLTLIDCLSAGVSQAYVKDAPSRYYAEIFPHYVAIGRAHLDPNEPRISSIDFTTSDLTALFYDFDAFGSVIDARPIMDTVLSERRALRRVEAGEGPQVLYFTGKHRIAEVSTAIGMISVDHRPSYSTGGPSGVFIKNRIVVSIKPESSVSFTDAVDLLHDLACFFSVVAGRTQSIDKFNVTTTETVDGVPLSLVVCPSYRWKVGDKSEQHKPHPADVPLDPIRYRAEFDAVLTNWISRHGDWRVARFQYLSCMQKAGRYDAGRLVGAANMFDILPGDAVPFPSALSEELEATRRACVEMFRVHAPGVDRDSALSALGRLGKPSLPKKIAYRVKIVESKLGSKFPDLQFVATVAVKCRNYFVHGSSSEFHYPRVEPFLPFLTDALEFIFAASDLIDAGWDAHRWDSGGKGWGHSFSRFRSGYDVALADLRRTLQ